MNLRTHGVLAFALACATAGLGLVPQLAEAQSAPPRGGPGARGDGVDLLEEVLGGAGEIGLSPEQISRLREFQTESAARTSEAREVLEAWREVRDALALVAEERRAIMDELRATVTVEQMERIQELVGPSRPGGRANRVGPRGRAGQQRFRGRPGFRGPAFRGPAGAFAPARLDARRRLARQRLAWRVRRARREAFR